MERSTSDQRAAAVPAVCLPAEHKDAAGQKARESAGEAKESAADAGQVWAVSRPDLAVFGTWLGVFCVIAGLR